MTAWRWVLVRGIGSRSVHHLVAEWKADSSPAVRFDTACGSPNAELVTVEPGGEERCVACAKRVLGG